MEVILRIDDGPEKGKSFHFQEADNLLIGRQDPTSKAHVNIGPDDPYISRHHFFIEVRPPNCLVRDNGSTNGVFIRYKGRRKWERVTESQVNEGDRIKIGKTIFTVSVQGLEAGQPDYPVVSKLSFLEEKTNPAVAPSEEPAPLAHPELVCIRCGAALIDALPLGEATISHLDFMCPNCQAQVVAEQEQAAAQAAKGLYGCQRCGRDVSEMANIDNRAVEFEGYASYYCQACAKEAVKVRHQEIGGYLLMRELGRGGMGEVYLAWHTQTGRVVALKRLLPLSRVNNEQLLRFIREVNIMNELNHPGLVRLFEAGQQDDHSFFVSEYIADGNLAQFISKSGEPLLPVDVSVRLTISCLEALNVLHKNGYVHRDIKPENILIKRADGQIQPKLADFGLARSYERHGGTITKSGECAGTLMYMPPEQVLGFKNSKPPVDIYAMGVTLYYLLTGRYSLKFPTQAERERGNYITKDPLLMILEDDPIPVQERRADLPAELCRVINQSVCKDSAQRYSTTGEFAAELANALR